MIKDILEKQVSPDLNLIYTDMLMLQEGVWVPDDDSVKSSVDTIERIANTLGVELKDIRL